MTEINHGDQISKNFGVVGTVVLVVVSVGGRVQSTVVEDSRK